MTPLQLALALPASYLGSLWVYGRLRAMTGRRVGIAPQHFRRLHLAAALGALRDQPHGEQMTGFIEAFREGGPPAAERWLREASNQSPSFEGFKAWSRSILDLVAAENAQGALTRYRLASRGRRAARRAQRLLPAYGSFYLELYAVLAFLTDGFNLEFRLAQTGLALRRALRHRGADPLLHLLSAHRAAWAGQLADASAALARALYHARGDRFIAQIVVSVPAIGELSPALMQEAQEILEREIEPASS